MGIEALRDLAGTWALTVDLPGAEDVRGQVVFEVLGEILVQRITVPMPEAPDSCSVIVATEGGGYVQHYFDSRGVARLYAMTFDGRIWTLERTTPDFSPLEFSQRFVGTISDDRTAIKGEWRTSDDGQQWQRDFGLTYTRVS
ncbi:MAG TPA: hypothetical protein VFW65_24770 [Pseudonocardiaceae bacterium]|nr:hypothetical protein [Pseudonocardiaceae bacterium]